MDTAQSGGSVVFAVTQKIFNKERAERQQKKELEESVIKGEGQ